MQAFKPKALTLALAVASLSGGYAVAQEEQEAANLEEVLVTGIRASLMKSQAVKQNSSSIVEVITAEHIGKLPDPSISETIARLPG